MGKDSFLVLSSSVTAVKLLIFQSDSPIGTSVMLVK